MLVTTIYRCFPYFKVKHCSCFQNVTCFCRRLFALHHPLFYTLQLAGWCFRFPKGLSWYAAFCFALVVSIILQTCLLHNVLLPLPYAVWHIFWFNLWVFRMSVLVFLIVCLKVIISAAFEMCRIIEICSIHQY